MIGTEGTARPMGRLRARLGAARAVLAALALLWPQLGHAQQSKELVADVIISVNRSVPSEKALRFVHTRKNMEYSRGTVQGDLDRLADTHLFKNIRARTEPTSDGR